MIRQAVGLALAAGLAFGVGLLGRSAHVPAAAVAPQHQLAVAGAAFREGHDRTALALYTQLADKHDAAAEYWLAHMTELGIGVASNPTRAIALYRKAAAQGNVPAEARLGEIYLDGNIVPPNFAVAMPYLDKAALQGNVRAATALSRVYRFGLGRKRDLVEAYSWLEVAVLEGGAPVAHERDLLLARLSAAQQQAALARTDYLMAKIASDAKARSPAAAPATQGTSGGVSAAAIAPGAQSGRPEVAATSAEARPTRAEQSVSSRS